MLDSRNQNDFASEDTLGGRISLARDAAGVSVQEVSQRLGVLASSWNAWESDSNVPRANRLTMMAGLLGVSPSWLLNGVGAGPTQRRSGETAAELVRDFRKASEDVASLNKRMQEIAASLNRLQPSA